METEFDIIRKHTATCPVTIEGMARDLGLAVKRMRLPDSVSGKLVALASPPGFEIHVNSSHSENRIRFTIAHEIAHYVLHRDLIRNGIVDDELYRSEQVGSRYETQANAFAADLLMPKALVKARFEKLMSLISDPDRILETMASDFQVSRSAMRIRLRTIVQLELPL